MFLPIFYFHLILLGWYLFPSASQTPMGWDEAYMVALGPYSLKVSYRVLCRLIWMTCITTYMPWWLILGCRIPSHPTSFYMLRWKPIKAHRMGFKSPVLQGCYFSRLSWNEQMIFWEKWVYIVNILLVGNDVMKSC